MVAAAKKAEPYIRVVTRRISQTNLPGSMTELAAMTDVCEKFPGDEWVLFDSHFVGVEPGPVIDVMLIFVKAEFSPPAHAEWYWSQIATALDSLQSALSSLLTCEDDEDCCEIDLPEVEIEAEVEAAE